MMRLRCFCLAICLVFSSSIGIASSQKVVKSLPGFDDELPFYLETGYIGVGELEEVQLFYYFVESQRSPSQDPIMLWLTGGPGCSVLSAFFYEQGPVEFSYVNYTGSLPTLHLKKWTWTKAMSVIYVDQPVGTGFSYSTTQHGYYVDDHKSASQTYEFLRKWLLLHPQYLTNILYIGGDSYSGIPLPIVVQKVMDGNDAGDYPYLNLKGYVLGNPKTDDYLDDNSRVPLSYRLALLSQELYDDAKADCGGDYINVNANNSACLTDIESIDEMLLEINLMQILEPTCKTAFSRPVESLKGKSRMLEESIEGFLAAKDSQALWCREYNYVLSGIWANDKGVRDAIGVRPGTKGKWARCNSSIAYTKTVSSSVGYHKNLAKTDLRALIYSGDHDLSVTHVGTQDWINTLNLTVMDSWRAWWVDGQIAGYTYELIHSDYTLDFATVKGAGHVAPEYRPQECYEMMNRWLAYYPL